MKGVLFLVLLAGCAAPPPVYKPVTVDMPVVTPCKTAPVTPPDFALNHTTVADNLFIKTRAALVELDQRKAYEAALQAQVTACQ
jgi:hypothetical protein